MLTVFRYIIHTCARRCELYNPSVMDVTVQERVHANFIRHADPTASFTGLTEYFLTDDDVFYKVRI